MHHPHNDDELLCGCARLEILKTPLKKMLWDQLSGVTVSRFNFTGINVHDHKKKTKNCTHLTITPLRYNQFMMFRQRLLFYLRCYNFKTPKKITFRQHLGKKEKLNFSPFMPCVNSCPTFSFSVSSWLQYLLLSTFPLSPFRRNNFRSFEMENYCWGLFKCT